MIDRILFLMEKKCVSANQLAKDVGLSNSAISEWKKGKGRPSSDAIIKLAKYFDVSTDYLLTGQNSSCPHKQLLDAYDKADEGTRKAVDKLLDID